MTGRTVTGSAERYALSRRARLLAMRDSPRMVDLLGSEK